MDPATTQARAEAEPSARRATSRRRIEGGQPTLERTSLVEGEMIEAENDGLEQSQRTAETASEHAVEARGQHGAFREPRMRGGRVVSADRSGKPGHGQGGQQSEGGAHFHGVGSVGASPVPAGGDRTGAGAAGSGRSGKRDSTSLASFVSWPGSGHCDPPQLIETTTPRSRTR